MQRYPCVDPDLVLQFALRLEYKKRALLIAIALKFNFLINS
jgi:hypothetical protein